MYSKHLVYLIFLASQPCPICKISRVLILRFPSKSLVQASCSLFTAWIPREYPLLSPVFFLLPLVWRFCCFLLVWRFFRDIACFLFPFSGDSLMFLSSGFCRCLRSSGGILSGSYLPLFPVYRRYSRMDCRATAISVPECLLLYLCYYHIVTNKVSYYSLPFSLTGLFWWPSFLKFCEETDINIEVIEERLVMFFLFNSFRLTMSHSDLYQIFKVMYAPCCSHGV